MIEQVTPEKFADVFELLESKNVHYVVVGGIAGVLHGYVRPVGDLDIVIDPSPGNAERTVRAISRAGFAASIPLPLQLVTVMRFFDHLSREVDVFIRYHIPFHELWSQSNVAEIGKRLIRIQSLEHLLLMKGIYGRQQDLTDIEG